MTPEIFKKGAPPFPRILRERGLNTLPPYLVSPAARASTMAVPGDVAS